MLDVVKFLRNLKSSGVDIVQLRDKLNNDRVFLKEAFRIKEICKNYAMPFIINDRSDLARAVDSDGLHLGQDDLPIDLARKILGRNKIIGISCHTIREALKAQREGADYISFGPIFSTPLKPQTKAQGLNLLKRLIRDIKIPFFAIGGINPGNISRIMHRGVKRVAVCRSILVSSNPGQAAKQLESCLRG
ncbi:MAG: thiamine phosphate synthase [Candidatus Omnitrophica bacterium]|nr:thiamine phosphate synthase [Candidatus Omnitrophota bacterium]